MLGFLSPRFLQGQGILFSRYRMQGQCRMSERVRRQQRALQKVGAFAMPLSESPQVSVVIPVHDQLSFTINCLKSIVLSAPSTPFEVLVVDDASKDKTLEALGTVKGLRLISNPENEGFIRSCNKGALVAKGQYLLFLNNDTLVMPGWLDALVDTFAYVQGTGLVGSRLVFPDGTLQEAGCLVRQDGTPWMVGRFQDADLPAYTYAREVDYVSGASLMVPKALFEKLGGFDEHYCPAYCEDADLGLKVRRKGYRVVYQPFSTVIHYEGVSNGRTLHAGVKAWQVTNIQKFRQRWMAWLEAQGTRIGRMDGAKDGSMKGRVLFLTSGSPKGVLSLLQEGYQVTWFPPDMPEYPNPSIESMQRKGVEVLYRPFEPSVEDHLRRQGNRYLRIVFDDASKTMVYAARHCYPNAELVNGVV